MILNFEQVATSFLSTVVLIKFGRKTIIQGGTAVCSMSLTLIAVGYIIKQDAMIITGLIIFAASFGLAIGPVPWIYLA